MSDQITSSDELRNFLSDKAGRRKIDTTALLDLHGRAAAEIDALNQRVAGLQQRLTDAEATRTQVPAAPVSAPVADNTSDSAVLILRNAQIAADETLAEASRMQSRAAVTLDEAEAHAQAKAEQAIEQARTTAGEIVDAAELQAADILVANQKTIDRAEFLHRQYIEKAGAVRREAEALVEFSRQVESLAEAEIEAPAAHASPEEPATAKEVALDAPTAEVTIPDVVVETPPAPPVEAPQPVPEPTIIVAAVAQAQTPPPPPPPAPAPPVSDLLDLTEADLEQAVDATTIEDELFSDELIDIREPAVEPSGSLQFFGRD